MPADLVADDQRTLYFPVDIGEYEHHPSRDTEAVVAAVAELFGMFDAEHVRWTASGMRDWTEVRKRLRQLVPEPKDPAGSIPGNVILHWMGHGSSDGAANAYLAVADSVDDDDGFLPGNLLEWVGKWRCLPATGERWAIVIIDACGSDRFVELLAAEAWKRPHEPRNVLLVATARDGSTDLRRFRHVLSTVLTKTFMGQNTISLYELSRQLIHNLNGCPAPLIRVDPGAALRRRIPSVPSVVSTSVDQVKTLEDVMSKLSLGERWHFLPKAKGTELGDQNWYFEGREAERARILGWLRDADGGMLVVTGAAGCGKSALLGHIVVRVRPELRTALEEADLLAPLPGWRPPDSDPLSVVIHLSGLTPREVVTRIARSAGFGDPPASQLLTPRMDWLIDRISRQQGRFTLLVDGLDEADLPLVVARHVLQRLATAPRTRVIVGTRRSTAETIDVPLARDTDLLDALGADALNAAPVTVISVRRDPQAMERYARRRLVRAVIEGRVALSEPSRDRVAAAIGQSDREFLFARLAVHEVIRSAETTADPVTLLPGDHRQLFARAVDRIAAELPGSQALLRALAIAQGQGLPIRDGVWRSLATALGREPLEEDDSAIAALIDSVGPYLTVDVEAGQTVYRLGHRTFNEHFLAEVPPAGRSGWHERAAEALIELARAEEGPINPYIERHLAGHVAEAGVWPLLADAPDVLDRLDPQSVAAEIPNDGAGGYPAPVAATAAISDLLCGVPPHGRAVMRAVEMARHWGASSEDIARTQAPRSAVFRLAAARTPARQPYKSLPDRAESGVTALAPVRMPNGRTLLAAGHADGTVRLWNPFTECAVGETIAAHAGAVTALAAIEQRSGATLIASGGIDHALYLWDTQRSQRAGVAPAATSVGEVRALIPVPLYDGRTLLALISHRHDKVRLWDPAMGGRWDVDTTARKHPVAAIAAIQLEDGTTALATGGRDQDLRLWDPLTGELIGTPLHGHTARIGQLLAVPMPDGRSLLTSYSGDNTIRLWDPDTGDCLAERPADHPRVTAMAAVPMPDGSVLLATGGSDHAVRLSDPLTGEARFSAFTVHEQDVVSLAVLPSPDPGRVPLIASGSRDGTVCLWSPGVFQPERDDSDRSAPRPSILAAVETPHLGPLVVTAAKNEPISLWDPRTGQAVGKPARPMALPVAAMAVTRVPGGPVVAAVGRGPAVHLCDLDEGQLLRPDEPHSSEAVTALSIAPLPDGHALLATATEDGAIRVSTLGSDAVSWELPAGRLSPTRALCPVSLPREPPGEDPRLLLASVDGERVIRLWDLITGASVGGPLSGHTGAITALATLPAPDGRVILASGGTDATVRFWDPASGHPRAYYLTDLPGPVTGLTPVVSPSGRMLLAALDSGGITHLLDPLAGPTGHWLSTGARVESIAVAGTSLVAGGPDGLFFFDLDLDAEALPPPVPTPVPTGLAGTAPPTSAGTEDPLDYAAPPSVATMPAERGSGSLPGILAGVRALRDPRWDRVLGLDQFDPARADVVRRWLRLAIGPDSDMPSVPDPAAGAREMLRSLGVAALALYAHTQVALEDGDRKAEDRVEQAAHLVHPMRAVLDDALRGTGAADLKPFRELRLDDAPVPDQPTDPALPVLGVLSFFGLQSLLASFLGSAYRVVREMSEDAADDPVGRVLDQLDDPAGEQEDRPPVLLPRMTVGHADTLARRFGVDSGNQHFLQALIDPSWSAEGGTTIHSADSNAGLAVLGAFVAHSLALRATADALLRTRGRVIGRLPARLGARVNDLIPLFTDLGLDDALVYSGNDPAGPPPPRTQAATVMAVLAAAYLSHGADLDRLSGRLPVPVAEWLRLGALAAVPGSADAKAASSEPAAASEPPPSEPTALERRKARSRPPGRRSRRERTFSLNLGESIMIRDDIEVEVSSIPTAGKVRLRFDAPDDVPVDKYEVWLDKREQRRRSVAGGRLQPTAERRGRTGPPKTRHKGGLVLSRRPGEEAVIGDTLALRTFVRVISVSEQGLMRLAVDPPEGLAVKTLEEWKKQLAARAGDEEEHA